MCDYSLRSVRSRPAKLGERLVTRNFGTGTRGFASVDDLNTAVCLLPGTELGFAREVSRSSAQGTFGRRIGFQPVAITEYKTAIFRQINKAMAITHHDALVFPDGKVVLVTQLNEGQEATVLQLPAEPRTAQEATEQKRVPIVA
jgi:hypothetical protein